MGIGGGLAGGLAGRGGGWRLTWSPVCIGACRTPGSPAQSQTCYSCKQRRTPSGGARHQLKLRGRADRDRIARVRQSRQGHEGCCSYRRRLRLRGLLCLQNRLAPCALLWTPACHTRITTVAQRPAIMAARAWLYRGSSNAHSGGCGDGRGARCGGHSGMGTLPIRGQQQSRAGGGAHSASSMVITSSGCARREMPVKSLISARQDQGATQDSLVVVARQHLSGGPADGSSAAC